MPINQAHKGFIETTFTGLFDDLPKEKGALALEISRIKAAFYGIVDDADYHGFSQAFENPDVLNRISAIGGAVTYFEMREALFEFVNEKIHAAVKEANANPSDLGWDTDELKRCIPYFRDHIQKQKIEALLAERKAKLSVEDECYQGMSRLKALTMFQRVLDQIPVKSELDIPTLFAENSFFGPWSRKTQKIILEIVDEETGVCLELSRQ